MWNVRTCRTDSIESHPTQLIITVLSPFDAASPPSSTPGDRRIWRHRGNPHRCTNGRAGKSCRNVHTLFTVLCNPSLPPTHAVKITGVSLDKPSSSLRISLTWIFSDEGGLGGEGNADFVVGVGGGGGKPPQRVWGGLPVGRMWGSRRIWRGRVRDLVYACPP